MYRLAPRMSFLAFVLPIVAPALAEDKPTKTDPPPETAHLRGAVERNLAFLSPESTGAKTMIGRMVYYSGRVQGVGFRATTVGLAKGRPVTGWVKNLADGRVKMLVEGAESDVEAFLKAVREHWKDYIEKEQIEKQAASEKYKGFEIAR